MAKILLVEDDNNLREIYEARLQAEGYTIVSAMDGEEALVIAKKEKPDLIISDVMMPRVSGFEMLDILRNTDGLKEVKVIMLTALGQAEDKVRADSLGADRYLVKSQVTLEDIVKAAQELLGPADTTAPAPVEPVTPVVSSPTPAVPVSSAPVTPAVQTTPLTVVPAPVEPVAAPAVTPPSIASNPQAPQNAPALAPEPAVQVVAPAQPNPTVTVPDAPDEQPPAGVPTPTTPPEPPATDPPMPEPAPAPPVPTTDPSTPTIPGAQSTSDETAAIKAQIESFVSQNSQTAPKPSSDPVVAMTNAIKDLVSEAQTAPKPPSQAAEKVVQPLSVSPTPSTSTAVTTPPSMQQPSAATPAAPTTPPESAQPVGSVSISGKKIIQPIPTEVSAEPNLNELLAKEGITNMDDLSTTPNSDLPQTSRQPEQPAPSSSGLPSTPHPPGHVISPNNGIDPNSIAL